MALLETAHCDPSSAGSCCCSARHVLILLNIGLSRDVPGLGTSLSISTRIERSASSTRRRHDGDCSEVDTQNAK